MYEHGSHTSHADGLAALREIILYGFLLQHHSGDVSHGEVHGVTLHDMFALYGSEHGVCPAEFALALILDGSGADEPYMGGQIVLAPILRGRRG